MINTLIISLLLSTKALEKYLVLFLTPWALGGACVRNFHIFSTVYPFLCLFFSFIDCNITMRACLGKIVVLTFNRYKSINQSNKPDVLSDHWSECTGVTRLQLQLILKEEILHLKVAWDTEPGQNFLSILEGNCFMVF